MEITERKLASARANGARSKGPVTPEGKARSSQNSLRHGLCANTIVLSIEDRDQYQHLRDVYIKLFRPANEVELDVVEQMVNAKWRERRSVVVEAESLNIQLDDQEHDLAEEFEPLTDPTRLATASNRVNTDKYQRYETRLIRQYNRAVGMLKELRRNFPNEPSPKIEHPAPDPSPAAL